MITEEKQKRVLDKMAEQSRRQDYKQHCQGILEGINKFDDNTAKRAIWELVQNARDLSEHARIRMELYDDKFVFAHKGKPFDYETFTSLIKQLSSADKEDANKAGQFGTGFMTTHKYSRKICIDGSLEVTLDTGETIYADIDGFVLDRTPTDIQGMIGVMSRQLETAGSLVHKLLETGGSDVPREETVFTYELDAEHYPAAKEGVEGAIPLIPYVMALNDKIDEISVKYGKEGRKQAFVKSETATIDEAVNLRSLVICIKSDGGAEREEKIFYLQSPDKSDIVILPLRSETEAKDIAGIPRLFIYFPLLGTQNFGVNYIFHSRRFFPEEPRNAIVLPEDNIDKREKYDADVGVLRDMLRMLFAYLKKYAAGISNAKLLAPVNIDISKYESRDEDGDTHKSRRTEDFYKELKNDVVKEFKTIPFVRVGDGSVSAGQSDKVRFLAPDIVAFLRAGDTGKYLDVIYSYAARVAGMPCKDDVLDWSEIVAGWDAGAKERFVSIDEIVARITEENKASDELHDFLLFLKESNQTPYFSAKPLIPNRDGELRKAGELYNAGEIPGVLYNICKDIIPQDTSRFVDERYVDICGLPFFGRNEMKRSINDYVAGQRNEPHPFGNTLPALLRYCSVFPAGNGKTVRNNMMPYICELFGREYREQVVPPTAGVAVEDEQKLYRTAFAALVKYTFRHIAANAERDKNCDPSWYERNKELHYALLSSLCNTAENGISSKTVQEEYFSHSAIFPDMEGVLHTPEELCVIAGGGRIAPDKLERLFDFYARTTDKSCKARFVDERYAQMFDFAPADPKTISNEIDEALKSTEPKYENPVTFDIINCLDEEEDDGGLWHKWFDNIERDKANIFLNRLRGDERADTYSFMRAPAERRSKVAELIGNPRFDEIIEKAETIVENERDKEREFNNMLRIGKMIEDRLRETLGSSLLCVKLPERDDTLQADDVQGGQDIIVRYKENNNREDLYYVEVKTKWSFSRPAHMSTLQMRKAVLNPDRYALCCVDLTSYSADDAELTDDKTILNNTYVHLDIGRVLGKFLDNIVKDEDDEENHLKISDYRCDIRKGFFKQGQPGIEPLIEAVVAKVRQADPRLS
ncbi:MAG: hypothetical protein LUC22_06385 [Prevotella sp.]|nr:hypothetical protein [Prevotella sp.]